MSTDDITNDGADEVAALITRFVTELRHRLEPLFDAVGWADAEIEAAQRLHPPAADRIRNSFPLLSPTHPLMRTEAVYRSHCRELLDRVAHGEDTRAGTAAESCIALAEASLRAPLRSSAVGLYARMWRLAGLPPAALTDGIEHYEALHRAVIGDHEAWLRRQLRQDWRVLPTQAATTPPTRPR